MPKQKRWDVKRKCDMSVGNLNSAIDNLVNAGFQYKDVHPDIFDNFCKIVIAIQGVQGCIKQLRDSI